MYGEGEERKRLRNGIAWIETRAFEKNSYDALLYGMEFRQGYELDIVRVDFDNRDIDTTWAYTSPLERSDIINAEELFSEILRENYLSDKNADEWLNTPNYVSDSEVTRKTVVDSPRVRGDILRKSGEEVRKELGRFSEGLFEPSLAKERFYDDIWVEAGEIFD